MGSQLPKYDNPPVVETVLGVQFDPMSKFTSSHVGLYWSKYLDKKWAVVNEVNYLPPIIERFGEEHFWQDGAVQIGPAPARNRTQIVNEPEGRMIQIQDNRFVYNWRKTDSDYPSYEKLLPEFEVLYGNFQKCMVDLGLGELNLNHWEMTYVNRILKGKLWDTPKNWNNVLPSISEPFGEVSDQLIETQHSSWQAMLGNQVGRLRVSVRHVRLTAPEKEEAIDLRLAAQGPVAGMGFASAKAVFDIGHEAIVKRFTAMTSDRAHAYWVRKA